MKKTGLLLYVIEKLWPNAQALATSVSEHDGKEYPVFLDTVSRGLLWAAGRQ